MLGGSMLLDKYSRHIADDIEAGGFTISTSLFNVIEGGNHVAMAKTACLTALEFTNGFHAADPDIVVICGDRFEQLAIAMAAAYLNKTIAHIEGGDVTGSIDESVRHAITKLAHIHFVTNDEAHRRVLAMGEDPNYVFTTGSLDVEVASQVVERHHDRDVERLRRRARNRPDAAVPARHPASGDDRAREPAAPRRHAARRLRAEHAGDLDLAEPRRRHRRDGRQSAALPREHARGGPQDAVHHRPADERIHRPAEDGRLPDRQLLGRHQGMFVSRHAGREYRRAAAGTAARRQRRARRLRPGRDRGRDRRSRSPTAAMRRRTSTIGPAPARPSSTCWSAASSIPRSVSGTTQLRA